MSNNDLNLMIVDDVAQHITAACEILKPLGYPIRVANSGKQALRQIQQKRPTLLLLDIGMADISGFDICKRLKANPEYQEIAIIFITAYNTIEDIEKGFAFGAQDYVIKPYHHKELLARVQTHMQLEARKLELKQANQQLDQFTRNVSHDLRSPLQVIRQLIELLKKEPSGQIEEILFYLDQKSAYALEMIDRLLDLSRVSRQAVTFTMVELNSIIAELLADLTYAYPDQPIELEADTIPPLYGDRTLLRSLFQNLLDNAVKFSQTLERTVIQLSYREDGSHQYLSVQDNGVGFQASADKLFQIFERFHGQEYQGTGVGLSIVKCIMDRHGGSVSVYSCEGRGTKVELVFNKQK